MENHKINHCNNIYLTIIGRFISTETKLKSIKIKINFNPLDLKL